MSMFEDLLDALKKPLYWGVKKDSEGVESLARMLGWDGLVQEAQKNQGNPGRAVGKAAQTALTWYLGGPAWSGASESATAAQLAAQQAAATSAYSGLGSAAASAAPVVGQTAASVASTGAKTAGEIAAEQAAIEAAKQAGGQSLAAQPGMFNAVPGVTQGSPQHLALLEQNAGLGGAASDLTAQAAKSATGDAGLLDSLVNSGKADLAGMNDPKVWLDRLGRNASRFAGSSGKDMAKSYMANSLMGGPPRAPSAPPPPKTQQPQAPVDVYANSNKGGFGDSNLDALAVKLGIPRAELEKMLDQMRSRT